MNKRLYKIEAMTSNADPSSAGKQETGDPGTPKVKWHHKRWVKIVALSLAAVLLTSEIILHFMPDTPQVLSEGLSPQALLAPEMQELMGDPKKLFAAVNKEKKALKEQEELQKAAELAEKYIDDGEYEKAIEPVNQLMEKMDLSDEELLQMKMTRTALYFACERFDEASEGCTELISRERDENGYYYFMRSVCSLQKEDYQSSKEDLLAALEHGYEDRALCCVHLAFCENYLEDYEKVLEYAGEARKLGAQPVYENTLMYLQAVASLKLERFDDSISYINELLETEEYAENGELYYYRGVCWLTKEKYRKAYNDFEQAMEYGETTTMVYYNKGVAALGLNKLDEAKEYLEEVVKRNDQQDLTAAAEEILELFEEGQQVITEIDQ